MISHNTLVYLSLGGNIGNTLKILQSTFKDLSDLPEVSELRCSNIYITTPVQPYAGISQNNYLNCACCFQTGSSLHELLPFLQGIELKYGEKPSLKNAPRYLDIDLLFFGTERCDLPYLQVPHPRWKERLFVLIPLLDLTKTIRIPGETSAEEEFDLEEYVRNFNNPHKENVSLFSPLA